MRNVVAALTVIALTCPFCVSFGGELIMADFDSGTKPNNIGGDFGAWSSSAEDYTQGCYESFDQVNALGGTGSCMKLEYDVNSPQPAYCGFWMKTAGQLDASSHSNLVIWMKSDAATGGTSRVKIELKTETERGAYYVDGINPSWTRFVVLLDDFLISDFSTFQELVIVFEDHTSQPKEGAIYVDSVSLE